MTGKLPGKRRVSPASVVPRFRRCIPCHESVRRVVAYTEPMAIALNTLEYARRLRNAGFTEQQAEGQAQALAAAMTDSLATKADLRDLEVRVRARFDAQDAKFDARFDVQDAKFDARFDAQDAKFHARCDAQDAKLDARFDAMGTHLTELERRMELRLGERLADLERRVTVRLLAGVAAVSALVKLL